MNVSDFQEEQLPSELTSVTFYDRTHRIKGVILRILLWVVPFILPMLL